MYHLKFIQSICTNKQQACNMCRNPSVWLAVPKPEFKVISPSACEKLETVYCYLEGWEPTKEEREAGFADAPF